MNESRDLSIEATQVQLVDVFLAIKLETSIEPELLLMGDEDEEHTDWKKNLTFEIKHRRTFYALNVFTKTGP